MTAYYNEIDPFAAAWLRELIKAGQIAPGIVDERSIEDVCPADLKEFTQCHFFAGIGVWSYALRQIGWPDDRPIWTGSCPCQPFSGAGKGGGFADERHLWPAFFHLIQQCRPGIIVGEQVASKDGLNWFDLVSSDLEGTGHAVGAVDLCAAGVGAPHIRQRLWWIGKRLADADGEQWNRGGNIGAFGWRELTDFSSADRLAHADGRNTEQFARQGTRPDATESGRSSSRIAGCCDTDGLGARNGDLFRMDDTSRAGLEGLRQGYRATFGQWPGQVRPAAATSRPDWMADANNDEQRQGRNSGNETVERLWLESSGCGSIGRVADRNIVDADRTGFGASIDSGQSSEPGRIFGIETVQRTDAVNSYWNDVDWLFCRDGKWRAVEPGTFPLADGIANRVGQLRGYGNAIVAQAAQEFLTAALY